MTKPRLVLAIGLAVAVAVNVIAIAIVSKKSPSHPQAVQVRGRLLLGDDPQRAAGYVN